jgi:hypothetical protein
LDDVITLHPTLVLDFRYGLNRLRSYLFPNSEGFDLTSLGLPANLAAQRGSPLTELPYLNINWESPIPGSNTSFNVQNNSQYLMGTFPTSGAATICGSAENSVSINRMTINYVYLGPQYTFGTGWTVGRLDNFPAAPIGQGLASFLLGLPTGGSMTTVTSLAQQSTYTAAFIQDDWKISSKLTVNLGLRYEIETPIMERYNNANRGFNFTASSPIAAEAEANSAANPVSGVSNFSPAGAILCAGVNGVPRGMTNIDPYLFMPRVGCHTYWRRKPYCGRASEFSSIRKARISAWFRSKGSGRHEHRSQQQ